MTATDLTESTERGVWGGKSISVLSVAESYKKQIKFSILFSVAEIEIFPAQIHFDNSVQCDTSTGCTSIPHGNRHYRTYTHTILAEET